MGKRNVLIVEDSDINRKILKAILNDSYDIIEARNGKQALDILEQEKDISAILLDLVMPIMDGFEFLLKIGKMPLLSNIPIIVMTQNSSDDCEIKALNMGAIDFLYKPYKTEIIKQKLINVINLRESAAIINSVKYDALTGLSTKESFFRDVDSLIKNKSDFEKEIMCIDIQKFKLINDIFGLNTGDKILCDFANGLKAICEKYDALCSRINNDKFGVCIDKKFGKKFIEEAKSIFDNYDLTLTIKIRVGIYIFNDNTFSAQAMFDRAQMASDTIRQKYDADISVYDEKLLNKIKKEKEICDYFQTALDEKQFKAYYQPKVDLKSEVIVGAEALVRWVHPEKGLISPFEFIPVFESNGMITKLDFYLWERVCQDIRYWLDNKMFCNPISVNVSRADLYTPNLIEFLQGLLTKYKIPPEMLHLEITETIYMNDTALVIDKIKELRALGFLIEMDDFGSGYSSLSMLADLPIDILKLDMSFMFNISEQKNKRNILSFIISLAKWLKLPVVAEGVETIEQIKFLRNVDCNCAQGYYYSKPLTKMDFENKVVASKLCARKVLKIVPNKINVKKNVKKKGTILVIDDTEVNRIIIKNAFGQEYNIVEMDNAIAGFEYLILPDNKVDLILLDLIMPLMNGYQMLEKLKADPLTKDIPVIVMSQIAEDGEAEVFRLGATDYVSKPFNMEVLKLRVEIALEFSLNQTIAREKILEKQLINVQNQAEHDYVTGLWNLATIESRAVSYLKNNKNAIFMMLDLDNFKLVNDTLGHAKGDEVLKKVSAIITEHFRGMSLIARVGGDEFAIFIPNKVEPAVLQQQANALINLLSFEYNGINITTSIGISVAPNDGEDYQTLYKKADSALLLSKRAGKNRFMVYADDNQFKLPCLDRSVDWVLDEAPEAIFIVDNETMEVLYCNELCAKWVNKNKYDILGKKCYNVFWGGRCPYEVCELTDKHEGAFRYQYVNTGNNEKSLLKYRIIQWGGRVARLHFLQIDEKNITE